MRESNNTKTRHFPKKCIIVLSISPRSAEEQESISHCNDQHSSTHQKMPMFVPNCRICLYPANSVSLYVFLEFEFLFWQIVHFHNYISVFDEIKIIIIIPYNRCIYNTLACWYRLYTHYTPVIGLREVSMMQYFKIFICALKKIPPKYNYNKMIWDKW